MTAPLHSVVMPVLNGEKHVAAALHSALPQLGAEDEFLVVDNGSSDRTRDIVAGFGDPRLRLLTAERRGPSAARNVGLRAARGRYVSFMDHDDLWPAGRQDGLLQALHGTPGANAAHGRMRLLMEVEEARSIAHLDGRHLPGLVVITCLFDHALLARAGFFDETLIQGEDVDYLLRLQAAGMRAATYDGDAVIYRRHGHNLSASAAEVGRGMLQVMARQIARRRAQKAG